uniref:Uncharacterized protein n=1 Tax=Callithrix jacchus TaxID=9483 RepID=A0A5F4W3J9_CALJA
MDPLQKQNPASPSTSFPMTAAETSREGPAPSQPSYSEQLMMGLSNLSPGPGLSNLNLGPGPSNLSPGPSHSAPLPEGLLHERYREEKTLEEQRWERLEFLQRKKAFLRHVRRRHRDHMAPYAVGREARISPLGDRGGRGEAPAREAAGEQNNVSEAAQAVVRGKLRRAPTWDGDRKGLRRSPRVGSAWAWDHFGDETASCGRMSARTRLRGHVGTLPA